MRRKKLIGYADTSKIMDVIIAFGDEEFSFNLNQEIIVDENRINKEIKEQPSAYAFLGMLHKKLLRVAQDKKREMEKTYADLFVKNKGVIDTSTGRVISNDTVKEKVLSSGRYQLSLKTYIEAQHQCDIIETCVRSFEQRYSLIQTLSANIRKTN